MPQPRRSRQNNGNITVRQLIGILTCMSLCVGMVTLIINVGEEKGKNIQKLEELGHRVAKIEASIDIIQKYTLDTINILKNKSNDSNTQDK